VIEAVYNTYCFYNALRLLALLLIHVHVCFHLLGYYVVTSLSRTEDSANFNLLHKFQIHFNPSSSQVRMLKVKLLYKSLDTKWDRKASFTLRTYYARVIRSYARTTRHVSLKLMNVFSIKFSISPSNFSIPCNLPTCMT